MAEAGKDVDVFSFRGGCPAVRLVKTQPTLEPCAQIHQAVEQAAAATPHEDQLDDQREERHLREQYVLQRSRPSFSSNAMKSRNSRAGETSASRSATTSSCDPSEVEGTDIPG